MDIRFPKERTFQCEAWDTQFAHAVIYKKCSQRACPHIIRTVMKEDGAVFYSCGPLSERRPKFKWEK